MCACVDGKRSIALDVLVGGEFSWEGEVWRGRGVQYSTVADLRNYVFLGVFF